MLTSRERLAKRAQRMRRHLRKVAGDRLRLSVFRSSKHISVQLIDDERGVTVASASSQEPEFVSKGISGANIAAAEAVGKLVAERAVKAGHTDVVFDRSGYMFHGRVKALAEAARAGGLNF